MTTERELKRDAKAGVRLQVFLLVGGCVLLSTVFCPVVNTDGSQVYLWHLFGVAAFVDLMPLLCLPAVGALFLILALSGLDEGLLGAVTVILMLSVVLVFRFNPLEQLNGLGMWEKSVGHQVLLMTGVIACAVASRVRLYEGDGTFWGVVGSAMLLGYLLTPNPAGRIPIAESVRAMFAVPEDSFMFTVMQVNRSLAYLIPAFLFFGVLMVVQGSMRLREVNFRAALIVGWIGMAFLPALAFPLLIQQGVAFGSETGVAGLLRPFAVLCVLTIVLPGGFAHWILDWGKTGGRSEKPSLE